ncbi:hypothetical protein RHGRI_037784 [Rhododendron griersonianum]|uniref:4a-hydroxytetrahydrobiopterin dehydratase n=1 Tax=Rhododendron griersonianum TaxID=479676 RepID=A0AAV6HTE0_9ERIC|nr:hypothetical protein RHGRI_037784 [Rhododendron griersonianum]
MVQVQFPNHSLGPVAPTGSFLPSPLLVGNNMISLSDLSAKKCVPCNSNEMRPMTEQAAHELISQVPEWDLVNEGGRLRLSRSWKVKTFLKGLEFFEAVANVAEAEGHHPDLHLVGWNNVKIEIWTHAVGKNHLFIALTFAIHAFIFSVYVCDDVVSIMGTTTTPKPSSLAIGVL